MSKKSPLVSVVIITYNSSETVIETLESIKEQTYQNIELIISDDCSIDNTIEICNNWIEIHKKRFIQTKIITSNINTGVAANCNRGYKASQGEWIKGIAGDDILLPNCIELNINYIRNNQDTKICVSKAQCFHMSSNGKQMYDNIIPTIENQHIYKQDALGQLKILLKGNIIVTPTMFLKKEIFDKHQFNETYRYLEDIPFLIDITRNNIRIYFLNEVTVLYRFSSQSLSNTKSHFFPTRMFETKTIYFFNEKKYIMQNQTPHYIKKEQRRILLWLVSEIYLKNNRKPLLNRIIFKILTYII